MEIWLDSADISAFPRMIKLGFIHGVTTNPSILAQANKPREQLIRDILANQNGLLAVQVNSFDTDNIIKEAKQLYAYNKNRIIVKIPVTEMGLRAIYALAKNNIPTLATAVFNAIQFYLAAMAGSIYVAPYLGRMQAKGMDAKKELITMLNIIEKQHLTTKIMAAAIDDPEQIAEYAAQGVQAITIPLDVFNSSMTTHPYTQASLNQFAQDWERSQ